MGTLVDSEDLGGLDEILQNGTFYHSLDCKSNLQRKSYIRYFWKL